LITKVVKIFLPGGHCSSAPPVIPFAQAASASPSPALTEQGGAANLDFGGQATLPEAEHSAVSLSSPPRPLLSLSLSLSLLLLSRGWKSKRRAHALAAGQITAPPVFSAEPEQGRAQREVAKALLRRFPSFPGRFPQGLKPSAPSSPTAAAELRCPPSTRLALASPAQPAAR
jgi:hypothetical protein